MISRRTSDRSPRTESHQRRPTVRRGIKKRGILPSFGDIVLPIVSVAAVGLLVLAGRQFFLNGIKTSPGISSTRAYAEAPALIAERERRQERESEENVTVRIADERNENASLDSIVKQQEAKSEVAAAVPESPKPALVNVSPVQPKTAPVKVAQTPPKKTSPAPAKPAPAKPQPAKVQAQAKSQPQKTQASSQKKPEPKKTEPQKAEPPKKTQAVQSKPATSSNQWRVQIGAYTSKAGAQEAANKLKKAGYSATVYSNPASKHHKVWVSGGADKKSAERVVNAMKKIGYGSSFAFPPSK